MPLCNQCIHCLTPITELAAARLTGDNYKVTFSCAIKKFPISEGRKYEYHNLNTDDGGNCPECPSTNGDTP